MAFQMFDVDSHYRRAKSSPFWMVLYAIFFGIALYILYQVFKFVRTVLGGLNSGVSSIFKMFGGSTQAQLQKQQLAAGSSGNSYWNPNWWVVNNYSPSGNWNRGAGVVVTNPTDLANWQTDIFMDSSGVQAYQSAFLDMDSVSNPLAGFDLNKATALFNQFVSQADFSCFCNAWQNFYGTTFVGYLLSGWLFGLVGAAGSDNFDTLDAIIGQLPVS